MMSGLHNWYTCSHARPTYCNVCREALSGVTSHGLSCEGKYWIGWKCPQFECVIWLKCVSECWGTGRGCSKAKKKCVSDSDVLWSLFDLNLYLLWNLLCKLKVSVCYMISQCKFKVCMCYMISMCKFKVSVIICVIQFQCVSLVWYDCVLYDFNVQV